MVSCVIYAARSTEAVSWGNLCRKQVRSFADSVEPGWAHSARDLLYFLCALVCFVLLLPFTFLRLWAFAFIGAVGSSRVPPL